MKYHIVNDCLYRDNKFLGYKYVTSEEWVAKDLSLHPDYKDYYFCPGNPPSVHGWILMTGSPGLWWLDKDLALETGLISPEQHDIACREAKAYAT